MTEKKSMKALLPQLAKIVENSEAYISHHMALFLLGFESEPPEKITIVSPNRRRNRVICGYEIIFIFHGRFDTKQMQLIEISGCQLKVSTLENTLIDICKDMNYSPDIFRIADHFCSMPYNLKDLLSMAKNTSDTVCKRVSLLLAYSGRASFQDLPLQTFKRTPIKLDPRVTEGLIWNSLFFCKFPRRLLLHSVKEPPVNTDSEIFHWMELKALPEFCQKQFESEMIFIRNSPEPGIKKIIDDYFIEIYKSLSKEKFHCFLDEKESSSKFSQSVPFLLKTFLNQNNDVLLLRKNELIEWVNKNLLSTSPDRIANAIFYGIKLGIHQKVYEKFSECSTELFYAGKFDIINLCAETFLNSDLQPTPQMLLNITKTWSLQEQFDKALDVLEKAREKAEEKNQDSSVSGQLHYATGLVFHRMERSDDALSELFLAREYFNLARDIEELSRTENSLGNLYFSCGRPDSARYHYSSGLQKAKAINHKKLQASILANIGMLEYDLGNFTRAMNYLNQSYKMNQMLKNHWTASVVGMALGKLQLKLGYFSKALRIFRQIASFREKKGHISGFFEINSILAWICEIIGKSATATTYWNQTEKCDMTRLEPRSKFVGQSLRGMSYFFNKKYPNALEIFNEMLEAAKTRSASGIQIADCYHGMAMSAYFMGKTNDAKAYFEHGLEYLKTEKTRFQFLQSGFSASLLFPEYFKEIDFNKTINSLIEAKIYDPFWTHFAPLLLKKGTADTVEYLILHLNRTPQTALNKMQELHPGLKDIVKAIQTKANRASQFVTVFTPEETRTVHLEDYQKMKNNFPKDRLIFDGPSGNLVYNDSKANIKPGTIPHSILQQLFLAIPHPVEIESLYRSAWGMEFDPEFDFASVKSSLQRLKTKLNRVITTATLKRKKNAKGRKAVQLSVSVPWMLIFK